jgi:hypothetical protein
MKAGLLLIAGIANIVLASPRLVRNSADFQVPLMLGWK